MGQDGGVDGVGLGELAGGAGEVADLTRVDDGDGDADGGEGGGDGHLESAGCFEDDEGDAQGQEPLDEVGVPGGVVGVLESTAGVEGAVELGLGDVDANEEGRGHGRKLREKDVRGCSSLRMRFFTKRLFELSEPGEGGGGEQSSPTASRAKGVTDCRLTASHRIPHQRGLQRTYKGLSHVRRQRSDESPGTAVPGYANPQGSSPGLSVRF